MTDRAAGIIFFKQISSFLVTIFAYLMICLAILTTCPNMARRTFHFAKSSNMPKIWQEKKILVQHSLKSHFLMELPKPEIQVLVTQSFTRLAWLLAPRVCRRKRFDLHAKLSHSTSQYFLHFFHCCLAFLFKGQENLKKNFFYLIL